MDRHAHKRTDLGKAVDHEDKCQYLSEFKTSLLYLYRRKRFKGQAKNEASYHAYIERSHEKIYRREMSIVELRAD